MIISKFNWNSLEGVYFGQRYSNKRVNHRFTQEKEHKFFGINHNTNIQTNSKNYRETRNWPSSGSEALFSLWSSLSDDMATDFRLFFLAALVFFLPALLLPSIVHWYQRIWKMINQQEKISFRINTSYSLKMT